MARAREEKDPLLHRAQSSGEGLFGNFGVLNQVC
jgi:hypothetical protein